MKTYKIYNEKTKNSFDCMFYTAIVGFENNTIKKVFINLNNMWVEQKILKNWQADFDRREHLKHTIFKKNNRYLDKRELFLELL